VIPAIDDDLYLVHVALALWMVILGALTAAPLLTQMGAVGFGHCCAWLVHRVMEEDR
jgi:hypothetical protein